MDVVFLTQTNDHQILQNTETPLIMAARERRVDVVRALLSAGAATTLANKVTLTATSLLLIACMLKRVQGRKRDNWRMFRAYSYFLTTFGKQAILSAIVLLQY